MASIVLVRHGQASFGSENYDQLSDLGRRQSAATGVHLARAGIKPTRIYAGELQRQKDTAQLALKAMGSAAPVTVLEAFNEYDSDGVFAAYMPAVLNDHPDIRDRITPEDYSALKDRRVFQRLFFPVMYRWIEAHADSRQSHEPWTRFYARVTAGLETVSRDLKEGECAVVFTSGGVISASLTHALGLVATRSAEFNWRTANASVTRFMCTERGLELESYNHYTHLLSADEALKVTYL